jgi:ectoine hydroxylase-related dioxygenase (phytanoyl-CoA dioxygenase family)
VPDVDLDTLPVLDFPPLTDDLALARAHIDEYGMCLIRDAISQAEVDVIENRLNEQAEAEGSLELAAKMQSGEGQGKPSTDEQKVSRLLWNLINKGDCFIPLINHPTIIEMVRYIIGEKVLLCSMGAHMNSPDNQRMPLHQDQWPLVPHPMPVAVMCNVLLLITDNAEQNGGTRMVPGSHKWPTVSYQQMNSEEGLKIPKSVTAPRGTAVVYDARIWHSNGFNRSNGFRNNIAIPYLQPWIRPQENHQYSVRQEVFDKLTDEQRDILGFSSYGTLGGHDGSSVSPAGFDRDRESTGILTV